MIGNREVLVLFPDTNLFVQCLPLDQLTWFTLGEFTEIHLLVCRAVQSEIDKHKNQGSSRLAKRARSASATFRKAILEGSPKARRLWNCLSDQNSNQRPTCANG